MGKFEDDDKKIIYFQNSIRKENFQFFSTFLKFYHITKHPILYSHENIF